MSHSSLSKHGYIVNKDQLTPEEIKAIKKDLTVKPLVLPIFKDLGGGTKPYPIYQESPKRFFLPRFYGTEKFGPPILPEPKFKKITVQDKINLMSHQEASFDKSIETLRTVGGGVLCLPCGFGKTIIALKIIATLGMKTMVLVNKEFLMDQWIERIHQFLPEATIGIVQQKKFEVADTDIVIGMIHTLSKKDFPEQAFDDFGLIVADECHHLSAEMFSKALLKVVTPYMLGLSATPERRDGLSWVFYQFLGPLYHTEKRTGKNAVVVKQIKINSNSTHYNLKFNQIRGKQFKNTKGMITELCDFKERDRMIMVVLEELINQNRKILLLSERREHLEKFMILLREANLRNKQNKFVTYGLYYGQGTGINKKNHKKMLQTTSDCDIVLGTCAMASEALDIPSLNTLVLVTPMTDVEQASGRILRKFHKDLNPLIVDIVDEFANFPKHAKQREKYFKSENYLVESHNIKLSSNAQNNAYCEDLIAFLTDFSILSRPKTVVIKPIKTAPTTLPICLL